MPEILTRDMGGAQVVPEDMAPEKIKEVITELHRVGFDLMPESKSNVISQNVEGIVQISVFNQNLKRRYNITSDVRTELCTRKMVVVKSREGWGVLRIIEILKSLKSEMNVNPAPPAPSIADIAVGKRK